MIAGFLGGVVGSLAVAFVGYVVIRVRVSNAVMRMRAAMPPLTAEDLDGDSYQHLQEPTKS